MKTESRIQQDIFRWYSNTHCLKTSNPKEVIWHTPNEGQHKLISIGVLAGVSDLTLTFRGVIYFCEVKTPTGKQMPSQTKFQKDIENAGFEYFIVRSLFDFKEWLLKKENENEESKETIKVVLSKNLAFQRFLAFEELKLVNKKQTQL